MTPRRSAELDQLISTPDDAVIECVRQHPGDFSVLGAGGKMGFHFCGMLQRSLASLGRHDRVHAVSRFGSVRQGDDFEALGCQVHAADLSRPDQLADLPKTANVFFLAGVKFGTAHDPELLTVMNVDMPRLVLEHFRGSRFVAMSTGCVYSFVSPQSGGSTELDETDPPGQYAQSCKGREAAFFEAAEQHGTASALIRLNYSIDLRYGVLVDLALKVRDHEPIDVTTGFVNVIWQGDAIGQTIRSLAYASAPPFVLNVTGPNILRVRDLANEFAKRFDCDAMFVGEEAPSAWLSNAAKSHELFGKPTVGVDQMIDWVAAWIAAGGELLGKPTQFQARDGSY